MNRTMLILAGAMLALVACNKTQTTGAGGAAAPVAAETPPTPGAGLWEQTMSGDGLPQVSMSICLDAATASTGFGAEPKGVQCSERTFQHTAGGWSFSSTCDMGPGGKVKSTGVVTGDVATDYTVALTTETTGAANAPANGTRSMSVHAERKGDCPAGMTPGEAKLTGMPGMPAGMKMPAIPGAPK